MPPALDHGRRPPGALPLEAQVGEDGGLEAQQGLHLRAQGRGAPGCAGPAVRRIQAERLARHPGVIAPVGGGAADDVRLHPVQDARLVPGAAVLEVMGQMPGQPMGPQARAPAAPGCAADGRAPDRRGNSPAPDDSGARSPRAPSDWRRPAAPGCPGASATGRCRPGRSPTPGSPHEAGRRCPRAAPSAGPAPPGRIPAR